MLIALSVMLAVFAALMIFRQVHSRRQKAVAEIVAERLHVSDLEKYVDSEYSGRYVDAILCEELKSSMLDVYNRVCDVERRSRILMSYNPSMQNSRMILRISTALWMLTTIALKTTNCGSIRLFSTPFLHILSTTSRGVRLCRRNRIAWW